jgi:DNA-binding MurR/RpiR family transcriptional regulator
MQINTLRKARVVVGVSASGEEREVVGREGSSGERGK